MDTLFGKEERFLKYFISARAGWIFTPIGEPGNSTEISQETLRTHPRFEALLKESEVSDEDSRIVNVPQIVT